LKGADKVKLAEALDELVKTGAVEVGVAQDAVRLKQHAEAMRMSVGLMGRPGHWKVYNMGKVV
jgi:hypothetical protein